MFIEIEGVRKVIIITLGCNEEGEAICVLLGSIDDDGKEYIAETCKTCNMIHLCPSTKRLRSGVKRSEI